MQENFTEQLLNYEHNIKRLLLKKIIAYRPEIMEPIKVMQDLFGLTMLECYKLKNKGIDDTKLQGAFINKAKLAWREYEKLLTRRRPILNTLKYLYSRIVFTNHGSDFEATDLWNYLSRFLTNYEKILFTERVLYGVSYQELSYQLGIKPNTLSKQFNRIREKLYTKMQEEAFMQPSQ